ncbi:MAG: ClpP family protease [Lachnospiraceae bacterium]
MTENDDLIRQFGQVVLDKNGHQHHIYMVSIVGEVEGHENLPSNSKTTKYEHILPQLVHLEDDQSIDGILFLIQTTGGDVSAGLAMAECIASMSKPTVSLVIGDSHSIGVPLAVASDYSFIVPSGTMIIHPVRMSGQVIGAPQTFEYFQIIQNRITEFICTHSKITQETLEKMMLTNGILTKDLGTILVGREAVENGLICEVGGIRESLMKLHEMIDHSR